MERSSVEFEVSEFVRLDDGMKKAKKDLKAVRTAIKERKENIIKYMVGAGIDRITGIKGDTQCLECSQKTLKRRATNEQMVAKLQELLSKGVNDPVKLMEELNNCGGTYVEYRLSRRSRRISAASLVAGAVVVEANKPKKRKLKMVEKLAN